MKTAKDRRAYIENILLMNRAKKAGREAVEGMEPKPMYAYDRYSQRTYTVSGGVCGFAWVNIKPARGSFVALLKRYEMGHKSYYGGFDWWIDDYDQSMERKYAYACAVAKALREAGLNATACSRMD